MKRAIEITLCRTCAEQFWESKEHYIERMDKNQAIKDTCTYCQTRSGYDFRIYHNPERRKQRL